MEIPAAPAIPPEGVNIPVTPRVLPKVAVPVLHNTPVFERPPPNLTGPVFDSQPALEMDVIATILLNVVVPPVVRTPVNCEPSP